MRRQAVSAYLGEMTPGRPLKPMLRAALWSWNWGRLFALEIGAALVEESVHAFAEVLAHIGLEDQILALIPRQRAADAAHRLLGGLQRQRSVRSHKLGGLVGAALQRLDIRHHLVEQPERQRLRRLDEPRLEDQVLGAGRSD